MDKPKLIVLENAEAVCVRAAEEIVHFSGEAICTHGQFNLCFTGGNTPADTYRLMATRFHLSVDWKEVNFYWGDERCVARDDSASNFGMAQRTLLSSLTLKPGQVHRMHGEDDPAKAAGACEEDLKKSFSLEDGAFPRFDLTLLGLGDNAHIVSLFPGYPAIHEQKRLVVPVEVDAPQRKRITLTAPVINQSARIMFIVAGQNKAKAVKQVLEGPRDVDQFPGQVVQPSSGEVLWVLDKGAASMLTST